MGKYSYTKYTPHEDDYEYGKFIQRMDINAIRSFYIKDHSNEATYSNLYGFYDEEEWLYKKMYD